jgi:UrcA family protein
MNLTGKAAITGKPVAAFRPVLFLLAALVCAMTNGPAGAQEKGAAPDVNIATGRVQRTIVGRSTIGAPIELAQLSRRVNFADLDLTTASGAAELTRRVRDTAREACDELDRQDPLDASAEDTFSCVREATNGAMEQEKAVIAAAAGNSAPRPAANSGARGSSSTSTIGR